MQQLIVFELAFVLAAVAHLSPNSTYRKAGAVVAGVFLLAGLIQGAQLPPYLR